MLNCGFLLLDCRSIKQEFVAVIQNCIEEVRAIIIKKCADLENGAETLL